MNANKGSDSADPARDKFIEDMIRELSRQGVSANGLSSSPSLTSTTSSSSFGTINTGTEIAALLLL
jgi:hypothetical protein